MSPPSPRAGAAAPRRLSHHEPLPADLTGPLVLDSTHPDFGVALGRVVTKEVAFLGERYETPTVKALAVGPKNGRSVNPVMNVGREFFVGALRDYEDWQEKWWREAIQNAVDAGATKVKCNFLRGEDGVGHVSCEDNGGGMTEEVLINKFLMLGATTKQSGGGTTGGFGKAKELLLLPWLSWQVHTRDIVASGTGIDYTIEKAPMLRGTRLTVRMPQDQQTDVTRARWFLAKCSLPNTKFLLNGEAAPTDNRHGTVLGTVGGKVRVSHLRVKGMKTSKILVRANGIFMFSEWLSDTIDGVLVAEILVPSIDVLTANRDGFRDSDLRRDMAMYIQDLMKDPTIGLAKSRQKLRVHYRGDGTLVADTQNAAVQRARAAAEQSARIEANLLAAMGSATKKGRERIAKAVEIFDKATDDTATDGDVKPTSALNFRASGTIAKTVLEVLPDGPTIVEVAAKQLSWRPDYFLYSDVEDGFKVPKEFLPASMSPRVLLLIRYWTECCRLALTLLGSKKQFGVGFCFSDDALALNARESGQEWLLLNPYQAAGETISLTRARESKLFLGLSSASLRSLVYALAIHEATHMVDGISLHTESFATAMTKNVGTALVAPSTLDKLLRECRKKKAA